MQYEIATLEEVLPQEYVMIQCARHKESVRGDNHTSFLCGNVEVDVNGANNLANGVCDCPLDFGTLCTFKPEIWKCRQGFQVVKVNQGLETAGINEKGGLLMIARGTNVS